MPFSGERLDNFRPAAWLPSRAYDLVVRSIQWRILSLGSIFTTGDNGLVFSGEMTQEQRRESTNTTCGANGLISYDGLLIKDVYITLILGWLTA